jgi:hypothetical protein
VEQKSQFEDFKTFHIAAENRPANMAVRYLIRASQ